MRPEEFLRSYRQWLLQFNDLRDIAFRNHHQDPVRAFSNSELEAFRTHPKLPWVEREGARGAYRVYRPGVLPYAALADHMSHGGDCTIWMTNGQRPHRLLLLLDIDAKQGQPDAQELADYISRVYLNGKVFIEPSTGGFGRHGYFVLDVTGIKRIDVWKALDDLKSVILADSFLSSYQARFCSILGAPTIWEWLEDGWRIVKRGSLVKLPYCRGRSRDLEKLKSLTAIPFSELRSIALLYGILNKEEGDFNPTPVCAGAGVCYKGDLGGTTPPPQKLPATIHENGWTKKLKLVGKKLRETNGTRPDPETLYDEYMATCSPTIEPGDEQRRREKLQQAVEALSRTFRPAQRNSRPFCSGEYLPLVQHLVPESEFEWKRRELINHARLADFVSVKLQDAFHHKPDKWFGRTSRNATIENFRTLKAKGLVDWVCGEHQYTKLLQIATKYGLLRIYEPFVPPRTQAFGRRIGSVQGKARLIGPGPALTNEYRQFLELYERRRAQEGEQKKMIA